METNKISYLCRLSDRIYDNAKKARCGNFQAGTKALVIKSSYSELRIDFDDYPELKPVAEKLLNYLDKSEERKQNEIKVEIARIL